MRNTSLYLLASGMFFLLSAGMGVADNNPVGSWEGTWESETVGGDISLVLSEDNSVEGTFVQPLSDYGLSGTVTINVAGLYTFNNLSGDVSLSVEGTVEINGLTVVFSIVGIGDADGDHATGAYWLNSEYYEDGQWLVLDEDEQGTWVLDRVSLPLPAIDPDPADGEVELSFNTDMFWSNGGGATNFDVYLGTSAALGVEEFRGNKEGRYYNPGALDYSTTYYWRIDSKNSNGTVVGDVWSFTTQTAPGTVANPVMTPAGGTFFGEVEVTLTCSTDGANIYYTTDGSLPTANSNEYTSAFAIASSSTVTAGAFKSGSVDSGVVSAVFTIIPVMSLGDFDGGGVCDLLWRRESNSAHFVCLVEGGEAGAFGYVGGADDRGIGVVELGGDYDGDGVCDLLWRRESNNAYFVTLMSGGVGGTYQYVGGVEDDISVFGVGDFDGNGTTDLLWSRGSNGAYFVTLMDGGAVGEYLYVGGADDDDIAIVGLGDFDGDGDTDVLWRRSSNGVTFVTLMNAGVAGDFAYVGWGGDTDIGVIGVGDFDGDGTDDYLSRRDSDGALWVTLMDGGAASGFSYAGGGGDAELEFVDIGDFDGDGTADFLWRRSSINSHFVSLMHGGTAGEFEYVGGGGDPDFRVICVGDYDGDGGSDLLWRRENINTHFVTLMDGGAAGVYQYVGGGDDEVSIIRLYGEALW